MSKDTCDAVCEAVGRLMDKDFTTAEIVDAVIKLGEWYAFQKTWQTLQIGDNNG